MPQSVSFDVYLAGPDVSDALSEIDLDPQARMDLGDGASVSRMLLLSTSPSEILSFAADIATVTTSVGVIAGWLYKLSQRKGVQIERIERTIIEQTTEEGLTRLVREEIERKLQA
jgi:hypothetical protein